jgi:hypothetical protein
VVGQHSGGQDPQKQNPGGGAASKSVRIGHP